MKTRFFIILLFFLNIACRGEKKTIEKEGGTTIEFEFTGIAVNEEQQKKNLDIIEKRLKGIGPSNLVIKHRDGNNTFSVFLPGEKDTTRYRELLTRRGDFKIYETYDNRDIYPLLREIDYFLKDNKKYATDSSGDAVSSPLFSLLVPIVSMDNEPYIGATLGSVYMKDLALVMEIFDLPKVKERLPVKLEIMKMQSYSNQYYYDLIGVKTDRTTQIMTGEMIDEIKSEQTSYGSTVFIRFGKDYYQRWENMTGNNIGKNLAMVIDDKLYSSPIVHDAIHEGATVISGNFSDKETDFLVALLKYGKLDIPVRVESITIIENESK